MQLIGSETHSFKDIKQEKEKSHKPPQTSHGINPPIRANSSLTIHYNTLCKNKQI